MKMMIEEEKSQVQKVDRSNCQLQPSFLKPQRDFSIGSTSQVSILTTIIAMAKKQLTS